VLSQVAASMLRKREPAQLHTGGAQVITAHADGTKSVRSIGEASVDLGESSDGSRSNSTRRACAMALQFTCRSGDTMFQCSMPARQTISLVWMRSV
jgi:hypothetical protein